MRYVVIEYVGEPKLLVDSEGKTVVYETVGDATTAANDCVNGIVVPLEKEAAKGKPFTRSASYRPYSVKKDRNE